MALWEKEEVQNKLSQRKKNGAKACPAQIQNEILLMHGSSRKNKKNLQFGRSDANISAGNLRTGS
jgi:hypothetical protein